jgi:hypothetical protein
VVGIPGTTGRPWHAREAWTSLVGFGLVLLAGAAALVKEANAATPNPVLVALYAFALVAGAALGVLNVLRALYKDARDDKKESPDDLRGCLHVILRMMCGYKGVANPPDGWMRVTVHRVDQNELEQVVDYVGSADRGAGRRLPADAGLIGAVLCDVSKRPLVFERPHDLGWELWVEYLVHMLKMPRDKALKTRRDRFSFLAVGIRDGRGNVAGVVYADAAQPGFFDPAAQGIVLQGCIGLANWVNERYL